MKASYAYLTGILGLGLAVCVQAGPSGGGFHVPSSGMTAGGGVAASGGGFRVAGSMGGASATLMSGGGFTVAPGIVASQKPAAGDLTAAHAFPVPFIPSQGHTQIVFSALTTRVTIYIYTLSGELVKTIVKDTATTDRVSWDVSNDNGEAVASGVYVFYMKTSDGQTSSGKLMVIK
ncbi:MAG: T9SS type A sorting domain-containing protein [Elusimicrobia bacterium]|nr:T9SS type A sorting domain-containing protein [Elusimicrobiota bacterium]